MVLVNSMFNLTGNSNFKLLNKFESIFKALKVYSKSEIEAFNGKIQAVSCLIKVSLGA